MKKIFKKEVIIAFIVGIILASSIAVYAYSYAAKDIGYTKPGTTTPISVETALNDLYNKGNKTHKYTYTNIPRADSEQKTLCIDIKNDYSNYQNITIDNINVQIDKMLYGGESSYAINSLLYSYDNTNGIITVSSQYRAFADSANAVTVVIFE